MSVKPKKRSQLRLFVGKHYFVTRRYMKWILGKERYAKKISLDPLGHTISSHNTPLLRELKNVDMWMQHNKVINLKIALEQLNGIVLQPGETFSYWKLIGKPTKRKGYQEGMVLFYGDFKAGVGGGLCQCSNLIYWITLHTSLTITERHRHSYDVFPDARRTQPFGSGATCAYNYLDLQIRNDTEVPYQLCLYMDANDLIGEWRAMNPESYTYEVYERDHRITLEAWGGYVRHNIIHRKKYNSQHELIDDQFITENHAIMMYQPLLKEPEQDIEMENNA
ncbi:VanW family protein [Paenibacillus antarcticus]|uniref:Vancomycin resistance protein n=1 Tax=Paenibacillus antarcticus TaxID=253703 RepID=A0A168NGK6_9BACL|nr:VanW family protein [Paenibacillus antarcticus]OAB45779.1 vancomycin resistance protein [Paenibacillus antarcticus]